MKKVIAVALATMFMLASVPAFACEGHGAKTAKKDSDESLMTSVDDGDKDADAKKAKKTKKSKEAKKDDKKDETEGEV